VLCSHGRRFSREVTQYGAPGVFDPPGYSRAIKVTGAQSILFLAGQVACDKDGGAAHPDSLIEIEAIPIV
jgi:enamine deaminase RidA (YjgF/YER057c/UK114 family)